MPKSKLPHSGSGSVVPDLLPLEDAHHHEVIVIPDDDDTPTKTITKKKKKKSVITSSRPAACSFFDCRHPSVFTLNHSPRGSGLPHLSFCWEHFYEAELSKALDENFVCLTRYNKKPQKHLDNVYSIALDQLFNYAPACYCPQCGDDAYEFPYCLDPKTDSPCTNCSCPACDHHLSFEGCCSNSDCHKRFKVIPGKRDIFVYRDLQK